MNKFNEGLRCDAFINYEYLNYVAAPRQRNNKVARYMYVCCSPPPAPAI